MGIKLNSNKIEEYEEPEKISKIDKMFLLSHNLSKDIK